MVDQLSNDDDKLFPVSRSRHQTFPGHPGIPGIACPRSSVCASHLRLLNVRRERVSKLLPRTLMKCSLRRSYCLGIRAGTLATAEQCAHSITIQWRHIIMRRECVVNQLVAALSVQSRTFRRVDKCVCKCVCARVKHLRSANTNAANTNTAYG